MRQLLFYISLLGSLGSFAQQKANLSYDQNYIRTKTYLYQANAEYTDQIEYFDGLGHPMQAVQRGITSGRNDLVTYQEYDAFGRESKSWLPSIAEGNQGAYIPLSLFKDKAMNSYASDSAYARPVYEASPLNRVLEQYGPGAGWYANKIAVRTAYLTNVTSGDSISCIRFTVTDVGDSISLSKDGLYGAGALYVTRMEDEDGNKAYEFKDKLGQVVLTRQMDGNTSLDTYYIYDDFGNLRLVLPPLAADGLKQNISNTPVKNYAYIYRYDKRNRCIAKKLPGCEWMYYIYDKADRLIFTRDGEQRAKQEWTFSIPDVFGRIVMTGICKDTDMLLPVTNENYKRIVVTAIYNTNNATKAIKNSYTLSQQLFKSGIPSILAVNYYDGYDFLTLNGFSALGYTTSKEGEGYGKRYTERYTTLLTGTATALLDDSKSYLYSAMYYDHRKRMIQAKSTNHLNGLEEEYIAYNFTGQPLKRQHIHSINQGTEKLEELYTYNYDHAGRLTESTHQLDNRETIVLANNKFDELGRLKTNSRNNQLELETSFDYNIRSWINKITGNLFSQVLDYTYNGNIISMQWKQSGQTRKYDFVYDPLSRLTDAIYTGIGSENYGTSYQYDKQGNMSSLVRAGKSGEGSADYDIVDRLEMKYTGNQLKNITDNADKNPFIKASLDFKDNFIKKDVEYVYNKNGALSKDWNKGIDTISYNSLNLPVMMVINNSTVKAENYYTYSASGVKLRTEQRFAPMMSMDPMLTTYTNNDVLSNYKTTDYVGNIVYEKEGDDKSVTTKKRILIEGGYIENGVYYFFLTDHLGNNRVVVNQLDSVIQQTHYYPFGMSFAESTASEAQPYKYNSKELDQMHGLNLYDYAARYMEPALGRFTSVDPHAESYYSWSPYAYVGNNPLKYTDPTGMDWYSNEDGSAIIWRDGKESIYTKRYEGEDGKSVTIEFQNIGKTYNQRIDNNVFVHYDQEEPMVYYFEDFKQDNSRYSQGALMGPDATGWSVNMEITLGGSFDVSVINAVTFNVGPKQGETFYYQVKGSGGGILDANVSINVISYYYQGQKSNFDDKSILGEGLEFSGSLGPFSGNWGISAPDQYGARIISQSYGTGLGLTPGNIGIRKTKTEGGWKMK